MSTDLSRQAENASTPADDRGDQPSDARVSQSASARPESPAPRAGLGGDQNMASTDQFSGPPAESGQPTAAQGPGDYRDDAAAGQGQAVAAPQGQTVAAPQGGASMADTSEQVATNVNPEPGGPSTEQAGAGAGQSFIGDASGYARRWESIQVGFVDDPQASVQEAETLVSDVMGEVVATFQQQRQQLEAQWSGGGQASTDDLRAAFQRYRDFFQRLLQI